MHDFRITILVLKGIREQIQEITCGGIGGERKGGGGKREEMQLLITHLFFFKMDLSHLPNGFYGLFLIS